MKIFYGIYLDNGELSAALDVARYIAEPDNIRFSHITLRGPYSRLLSGSTVHKLNMARKRGWTVRLDGVGSFMSLDQNTIMIKVDLLDLSDLMHKPDFADGVPHLTLYDGRDRLFADALLSVLYKFDFHDFMKVSKLQILSTKAPAEDFSVLYDEFHKTYWKYVGRNPSSSHIGSLQNSEKILLIEEILKDNFVKIFDRLRLRDENDKNDENLSFDFD